MNEETTTIEEIVVPDTVPEDITELAPLYKVLLHNDDITPGEFVVQILIAVFRLEGQYAMQVCMEAHNRGLGLVKVTGETEATAEVERAHALARADQFPLTFSVEEA